jgi:hypothetical protein
MDPDSEPEAAISPTTIQKVALAIGAALCLVGTAFTIWAEHDRRYFIWAVTTFAPGALICLAALYLDRRYWQQRKR